MLVEFSAAGAEPAHAENKSALSVLTLICIFKLNMIRPFAINGNAVVRD
jgi:hypothetical protein